MLRSLRGAGSCWSLLLLAAVAVSISAAPESDPKTEKITLLFTGLVGGSYGPCGCTTEPSGGFSKRSAYASEYASRDGSRVLHVDVGGILMPRGPYAGRVNPEMLNAIRDLPVSVLNLSPSDLFLWDQIAASDLRDHFISSNLSPLDPGRPVPTRYKVVEVDHGDRKTRIGFLGVSDPAKVKPNSGFVGEDPLSAVRRVKQESLADADFLVVLADIPQRPGETTLEKLARDHPEIIAVLTTEDVYRLHEPRVVNNAVLLSSVERGRYLGQLELVLDQTGEVRELIPEFIQLGEDREEDPRFLRIQKSLVPYLLQ